MSKILVFQVNAHKNISDKKVSQNKKLDNFSQHLISNQFIRKTIAIFNINAGKKKIRKRNWDRCYHWLKILHRFRSWRKCNRHFLFGIHVSPILILWVKLAVETCPSFACSYSSFRTAVIASLSFGLFGHGLLISTRDIMMS